MSDRTRLPAMLLMSICLDLLSRKHTMLGGLISQQPARCDDLTQRLCDYMPLCEWPTFEQTWHMLNAGVTCPTGLEYAVEGEATLVLNRPWPAPSGRSHLGPLRLWHVRPPNALVKQADWLDAGIACWCPASESGWPR